MKKTFILTLVVGLGIAGFLYFTYSSALHYVLDAGSTARVSVTVPQGATGGQVAGLLYDKRLINNKTVFTFYLREKGLGDKLKAGRFVFRKNDDLPKIVDILVSGKSSEYAVTLLEGWTARQMAEELESEGLTTASSFMDCLKSCKFDFNFLPGNTLEGYLYPDTYYVNPDNYSDEAFIDRLIETFKNKLTAEDWKAVNASKRKFPDIIKMASIVEREERNDEERPVVAGILWKRLDAHIGLGADATLLYGLGRTSGGLTAQDLALDSPYNTRKYDGFPPTAISNPSLSSIHAALYPKETDYWYYLHDKDGAIHYARTLDEHNLNKQRYLR